MRLQESDEDGEEDYKADEGGVTTAINPALGRLDGPTTPALSEIGMRIAMLQLHRCVREELRADLRNRGSFSGDLARKKAFAGDPPQHRLR